MQQMKSVSSYEPNFMSNIHIYTQMTQKVVLFVCSPPYILFLTKCLCDGFLPMKNLLSHLRTMLKFCDVTDDVTWIIQAMFGLMCHTQS